MDPHSADTADYRRGTVFGLTVAEIFILLLFLLLIMLATFEEDATTQHATTEAELDAAKGKLRELEPWIAATRQFETPEEIVTLTRARDDAERETQQHKEAAERHKESAERHKKEADRLQEVVNEALAGDDAAQRILNDARAATEQAEQRAEAAERNADQAREDLRVLRTKGHNPPCWYERVPDGKGGTRERPHYTFNIAVFAQHIVLRRAATPPGGATDDNGGSYAAEATMLGLDGLPYDQPLDDRAFLRALQPVHDAGKNRQVRTYPCIFWTRVWDRTPDDAKSRWQRAHDRIIEGMFGAYTVRNDPWNP